MNKNLNLVFGDIHNHNAHGYGVGSIERSVDIARSHLDFFAFTGHSSWHDLRTFGENGESHFNDGFKRLAETWPRVQRVIADSNRDQEFCSFLGFEWHSNRFGDQCVVFPDDYQPLCYAQSVMELRRFCLTKSALKIPHHLAYMQGLRGVNWGEFEESCTPVVEIYSWHGNSEDDRGPYPMISGSPGGRRTSNTVRQALADGLRFGFVASSDNHAGFPGAYGEGLMGALVADLTRPAILEAIRDRRTYALTGDRIELSFTVNGALMGNIIEAGEDIEVDFTVVGRDEIEVVEIVQDGVVVHRSYAVEDTPSDTTFAQSFQIRLEWGWGPWGPLSMNRITDWDLDLTVEQGRIERFFPCLASGPFDEDRRHRLTPIGDNHLTIRSYSSRPGAFRENPNHSVVLEIAGSAKTTFKVKMAKPSEGSTAYSAADLFAASQGQHTGSYPSESYLWHRILPAAATRVSNKCTLPLPGTKSNVYLRVKQKNGHMAWSSPVFINYR